MRVYVALFAFNRTSFHFVQQVVVLMQNLHLKKKTKLRLVLPKTPKIWEHYSTAFAESWILSENFTNLTLKQVKLAF